MSTRPPRQGHCRLPAAAAALALLVTTSLSLSQADATTPTAAKPAGAPAAGPGTARTVALQHLHDPSYAVTLATGDRVTLTAVGGGHYSITATSVPGPVPGVWVTAQGGPHRTTTVSALPYAAAALVANHVVDRNLFDVTWLAAHGDTGPYARIPVTVQYPGAHTAADLADRAAALPGASLVASHPSSGTVDLSVPAGDARAFWAAFTASPQGAGAGAGLAAAPTHLAGGALRAWPTGHPNSSTAEQPAADQPLHHLTEVIKGVPGKELNLVPFAYVLGVAGDGVDTAFIADSIKCQELVPGTPVCDIWQVGYHVPNGVYSAVGTAVFVKDGFIQFIDLLDPQITVAGDTTVTLDTSTAKQVSFSTPRPSKAFVAHFDDYRATPDGTWVSDLNFAPVAPAFWSTVTDPVSIGTFHVTAGFLLGQPPLTMAMTAPKRMNLKAIYWTDADFSVAGRDGAVRFVDRSNVPVVYAGHGTAEDFAKVDARGKLALITIKTLRCSVGNDQLENAVDAGAVGVLFDPTDPAQGLGSCNLPFDPGYTFDDTLPVPDIPFAELDADQARTLIDLLAHDTVRVTIDSYPGNSPYLYTLSPSWEGRVSNLHVTLSDAQLKPVRNRYHAARPGTASVLPLATWRPNEWFVGATPPFPLGMPGDVQEFQGPVSPDTVRERLLISDEGTFILDDVAGDNDAAVEDWNAGPFAPGAQAVSTEILAGQPGKWDSQVQALAACSFCRQGSFFYPLGYLASGTDPAPTAGIAFGFAGDAIHLFQDGTEIPQTSQSGFAAYRLPDQQGRYTLTLDVADTHTTWDFTSAAPTAGHKPAGYGCVGSFLGSTAPCEADPLVLLRYDAHTDLANTVTAGGSHQLDVTVYHQATDAPRPVSLKLWTSTDGGKTWQPAVVHRGNGGTFTATYTLPDLSKTDGALSIRAQATDAAGNDVTQVLTDAVTLNAASHTSH